MKDDKSHSNSILSYNAQGCGFALMLAMTFCCTARAGLLPNNIWPNPTLESDTHSVGVPDFWNLGGSDPSIDLWTTNVWVSFNHSLELNDTTANDYGDWYSGLQSITPGTMGGTNYLLRYNVSYSTSNNRNNGDMRLSVGFYDSGNNYISESDYDFWGSQNVWQEVTVPLVVPTNATQVLLDFVSGGALSVTGTAYLDDISLALQTNSSLIPYVEGFPQMPTPLVIRNWQQTITNYVSVAFNTNLRGQYLPLDYEFNQSTTSGGFSGLTFGLPSYVGESRGSGEGLSDIGIVLGGTLAGLNMASYGGEDRVHEIEAYYCLVNGHGLVLNNINSTGSGSGWYDIFPSTMFYQVGSRYPGRSSYTNEMKAIADSWLVALPVLSNNWQHTGFDFQTTNTVDSGWVEPDMAVGIAWLEYMAYLQFQNTNYLAAADVCVSQADNMQLNPFYEVLECYGPALAARMDAELGRNYSTSKHLNWIFTPSSDSRPGWGCEWGHWGNYDAYGLIGATEDSTGYAFSMDTYAAAGLIAPVARYQPQYARLIGRWLLHVAANANLFFPGTLATNMQASSAWVKSSGVTNISYEGVRNLTVTTPYSTGDATSPVQELNPYGAWGIGYMAALFQTSNVSGILQVNCLATENLPPPAYPTHLYYNPYGVAQQINLSVGTNLVCLYDLVSGSFVATNVTNVTSVSIASDSAVVLAVIPAAAILTVSSNKLLASGVIVDYWNGSKDSDGDGLPDWWESRYFGNSTNPSAQAIAANGFSNLECYLLGLNPLDPASTFLAWADIQPSTGYPSISWTAVGGKSYAIEYVNSLDTTIQFAQAAVISTTNVSAGVYTTNTFIDDFNLTGGRPTFGRYYRIRLQTP